jgi:hypothetical protein
MSSAACQPAAVRRGKPPRIVAIALAWTSGPGIPPPTGVSWMSCRSGSVAPTTTTRPRSLSVSLPSRTSENDTLRTVPAGPA